MRPVLSTVLFLMVVIAPIESAVAIIISPIDQGHQISAFDSAESAYDDGKWHITTASPCGLNSDMGFYGPAFAVFDFSELTISIDSAVLGLQVVRANALDGSDPEVIPIRLYGVSDIASLAPPADWSGWSLDDYMDDFWEHKADLTSGPVYGDFLIPNQAEDLYYEITLTAPAVTAINASLGGLFAIGFGPGPGGPGTNCFFPDENGYVTFGDVQLDISPVPEPCTVLLVWIGLVLAGAISKRQIKLT